MALSEIDSSLRYGDYNPDPCTFKVLVQAVPMWKIRSIARFKRSAFTKKVKVLRDQEAAARAEVLRVQEEEKQAVATKHTAETAPPVPSMIWASAAAPHVRTIKQNAMRVRKNIGLAPKARCFHFDCETCKTSSVNVFLP